MQVTFAYFRRLRVGILPFPKKWTGFSGDAFDKQMPWLNQVSL
jgi:hypothetical protein